MENHIFILSDIGSEDNEVSLEDVRGQYKPKAKKVFVHINSNGGEVPMGMAIHDFLKEIPQEVHTIGEGMVASIATMAFLAGDIREMKPNCKFLGHLPSIQASGNSDEIARLNAYMQDTKIDIAKIYAEHGNKGVNEMVEFMRLDTPISASEAKEMGFATLVPEFKAVAKYKTDNTMSETKTSKLDELATTLTEQINKIEAFFKVKNEEMPPAENITVELSDGSFLFVESEDGELAGKVAYIADAEGNRTEEFAPAGTHELQDGRQITVGEGGIVESVSESDAAEVEDLKTQLAAALKENEELKNSENASKEKAKKIQEEVKNLKKTVVGSLEAVPKANVKPTEGVPEEKHPLAAFAKWNSENNIKNK